VTDRIRRSLFSFSLVFSIAGCASKILSADNSNDILKHDEYEKSISIKEIGPDDGKSGLYVRLPGPEPVASVLVVPEASQEPSKKKSHKGTGRNAGKPLVGRKAHKDDSEGDGVQPAVPAGHQPALEDSEGYTGRRPNKDPFRIGEKTVMEASYFSVVAGDFTIEVRPFVVVNGHKSYHFVGTAKTSSVFEVFYAIDDWFETFLDFETMVPYSYSLHVKETKQLRETRTLFDWPKARAFMWDKKINEEKKLEEKNQDWELLPYSQNVFSAAFYLRTITLSPGKKFAFRLSHEKENLVISGEVLRKEHISTEAGEFDTVVVKPQIALNGIFKPVGDIFFWLTDDDRKYIVRIETKIKIGKVVAEAKKIVPGDE
jgi:hypothetical protein